MSAFPIEAFYRTYAYELLLQSAVPDYLEKVAAIVENVGVWGRVHG